MGDKRFHAVFLCQAAAVYATDSAGNSAVSWIKSLPVWAAWLIYSAIGIVAILLIVCCFFLVKRCRRKDPIDQSMLENPYPKEWDKNASGGTLAKKLDLRSSPALKNFVKKNPAGSSIDGNEDDIESQVSNGSKKERPVSVCLPMGGGNDYGRIDQSAKDRIRSIRMAGNIKPIGVAPPSKKALKMLGVEAEKINRPFDEDITKRMERIAQKSGGGTYNPGLATAKLGNQIAAGFKERRKKQLEKAKARKEKEKAKRAGRQTSGESLDGSPKNSRSSKGSTSSSKASSKASEAPGPSKFKAFMAASKSPGPSGKVSSVASGGSARKGGGESEEEET
eukprot:CAMPEP_0203763524 /NCGR_PEP_ID=MMETSP0098-20131031/16357_1 /ASSEMBLY_ACC=CAM_ASM_000208 /TAXON_ID=96639 /ORGANISM=" , Strain NY0313808BC1" /LENGTH=335 /DNA_ID=CAMNT_0050658441 /DNA_START=1810 /DNA_END=2814 /DNA_ORIENTATION=+